MRSPHVAGLALPPAALRRALREAAEHRSFVGRKCERFRDCENVIDRGAEVPVLQSADLRLGLATLLGKRFMCQTRPLAQAGKFLRKA